MKKTIKLDQEIRIVNLNSIWEKILPELKKAREKNNLCKIDLSKVEKLDGAGMQTILFLNSLTEEFPQNFEISGISDIILSKMETLGCRPVEREVK
ncbi:MAG: STAS domain-containing protein [Spirochaetales bacterium]|nr:STAS domain-containing protein [Spirochaetales bacterium]